MPEKTIRKYYDEIFRYCFHHVESRAAAEDLCQDTFLSFIERYGQNRSGSKVKNLLYTIAKTSAGITTKSRRRFIWQMSLNGRQGSVWRRKSS